MTISILHLYNSLSHNKIIHRIVVFMVDDLEGDTGVFSIELHNFSTV